MQNKRGEMMRQYIKIESKRLFHTLPGFLLSLFTILLLGLFMVLLARHILPEALQVKPFRVGLCVEGTDMMSDYVREYVKHIESTENLMEFCEMESGEIDGALETGELAAGIIIPERTAESIMDGSNIPIRVLFHGGADGAERYLQKELLSLLTECGAVLIDVPQAETLMLYEMQVENPEEIGRLLDLFHFGLVIDRESWFEKKEVSAFGSADMERYYLAAGLTLLLIFWGLGCGSFFREQEKNLPLLLARGGVPLSFQYGIKQILFFMLYLVLGFGVTALSGGLKMIVPVLLCCLMMSMQCSFFFELAPTASSGVVLNSILGFVCFFGAGGVLPAVFLPKFLTDMCGKLPAGICMEVLLKCAAGKRGAGGNVTGACLLWCLIFGVLGQLVFGGKQWGKMRK